MRLNRRRLEHKYVIKLLSISSMKSLSLMTSISRFIGFDLIRRNRASGV